MRRSKAVAFFNFSGGLNTKTAITSLNLNEASDLQNINLLASTDPEKVGFESRNGNSAFNSSAMVSASTAVSGLSYFRPTTGDDYLMAIAGTKIFKSDALDGAMDDITGAVTITGGANNIWTNAVMNDLSIFVGGAPDAPIKWNASGNAAALSGSPPSGNFCFQANNYFFIGNTTANPSRIAWSILGNPQDWSGSGSGTQDVSTNDGDKLIGASVLAVDHVFLFKQNSVHDMITRTPPFPVYLKFRNVGAVSKRGILTVDGVIYFITPQPRMKATDGYKIIEFPDTINDVWDGLNKSRLQYIQGVYYPKLRQIMWICSNGSSTTNNYCIIWDLDRKCWLRHPTGYKMNCAAIAQDYLLYTGAYDGKIYKQDDSTVFTDASESSAAINSYWRTGWQAYDDFILDKIINYVDLNFSTQTVGQFKFGVGFDFESDRKLIDIDMQSPGAQYGAGIYDLDVYGGLSDTTKIEFIKGRGKFLQFLIKENGGLAKLKFNGFMATIKAGNPVK